MTAVLEHLRPIVSSINTLIGNCENMEATYCVGNDVDVCRMFDQYLYKVRKCFSSCVILYEDTKYGARNRSILT